MNDERILFVGGPEDGKRKALPNPTGSIFQVGAFDPAAFSRVPTPADCMAAIGITTHTYTIKTMCAVDGSFLKVAVHSSVKDFMKQLVKGYRYHRKPRYR